MSEINYFPMFRVQFFDVDGPLSFGKLKVYYAGTSTQAITYNNNNEANPWPVPLDIAGVCQLKGQDTFSYDLILCNSAGATIDTYPNVKLKSDGTGSSGIQGSLTAGNIPLAIAEDMVADSSLTQAESGVVTATAGFDAGTLLYLGSVELNGVKISTDALSTSDLHLVTAGYVDALYASLTDLGAYLPLSGGTLTGDLDPNASGLDLGNTGARWDIFAGTIDASGLAQFNGRVYSDSLASQSIKPVFATNFSDVDTGNRFYINSAGKMVWSDGSLPNRDEGGDVDISHSATSTLTVTGKLRVTSDFEAGNTTLSTLTASTVPVLNASKVLVSSSVTATELGYLSGVTSPIQTQFGNYLPLSGGTLTGDLTHQPISNVVISDSISSFDGLSNIVGSVQNGLCSLSLANPSGQIGLSCGGGGVLLSVKNSSGAFADYYYNKIQRSDGITSIDFDLPPIADGSGTIALREWVNTALSSYLPLSGGTLTGNLDPNASGLDLGTALLRWDIFAQDIDASGIITASNIKASNYYVEFAGSSVLQASALDAGTVRFAVNDGYLDLTADLLKWNKDLEVTGALTLAGALTANGAVTLGNASGDDITVLGSLVGNVVLKTNNSTEIGSSSLRLANVYSTLLNVSGTATMAGITATGVFSFIGSTDATWMTQRGVQTANNSYVGGWNIQGKTTNASIANGLGIMARYQVLNSADSATSLGRFGAIYNSSGSYFQWLNSADSEIMRLGTSLAVSVPLTDQNGLKVTGASFAEIHVHDASTAQSITNGTTYTKLTAFTDNGLSENCTPDAANDKITATKTGIYRVTCSISASAGTVNLLWNASVFVGGVEQDQIHWQRKITTVGDVGSMSMSGYVDVTSANTDIDVRVRHDGGASANFTVVYANLNIQRVSDT